MIQKRECRFCGKLASFRTHDKCTQEYGSGVEEALLKHYTRSPTEPLPPELQKELGTENWKYYMEWKRDLESLTAHINSIKEQLLKKAEIILQDNDLKLSKLLTPQGDHTFRYSIKCEVSVGVEPRY